MSDFKKLPNHPLVCVLLEVRFSSILNLEKYIPEVQDQVRKKYPLFKKEAEQILNVTASGVDVNMIDKYIFTGKDKTSSFQLSPDRIIFLTTEYNRFDDFSENCKELLNIISDVISPTLYSRLGLRYSDCVKTINENNEKDLVSLFDTKEVFFNEKLATLGAKSAHRTETSLQTQYGTLVFRSLLGFTNMTAFDDLMRQNSVVINPDENPSLRTLLDFDHFWEDNEKQKDFVVEEIIASLSNLHEISRQAFWNVTSKHARGNVWS